MLAIAVFLIISVLVPTFGHSLGYQHAHYSGRACQLFEILREGIKLNKVVAI